ncbi:hypothetical protein HK105_205456 [Polyrhizophydium stewartii]|uniref:Fatty acid desaturase domain-containing protein n=1 Tax=Polyrhizophydium stewartii TaxID=2732419 RepID=A0ABR4N617_9FUNG
MAATRRTTTKQAGTKAVPLPGKLASKNAAEQYEQPPFTLKDVRDAVPAHCFKRDTLRSMGYVAHDLVLAAALFYAATFIPQLPLAAQAVAWPAYWVAQGIVCTGIWVLAHECGHGAFSPSKAVNDTVGYILHTALLVPYFSWKYTHSKHHKATNHMTKDQVFVPSRRAEVNPTIKRAIPASENLADGDEHPLTEVAPIFAVFELARMLIFGWPAYLIYNASSQQYTQFASHFLPSSPMFDPKHAQGVFASDIGVVAMIALLAYCGQVFGSWNVVTFYVLPYLMVNFWLVTITFLQHTDPELPHYSNEHWDFLKGALATMDRDYGILNYFHHHIGDTHVVHHLFSTMPHYHAEEATEAVKKVLGKFYHHDDRAISAALYQSMVKCRFVEDSGDVLFFKY